jgi:hypothetical protein
MKERERIRIETANWMESGMLMKESGCCLPSKKKRRDRGVADIFTSIITTLSFLSQEEFPSFHLLFIPTIPILNKREK